MSHDSVAYYAEFEIPDVTMDFFREAHTSFQAATGRLTGNTLDTDEPVYYSLDIDFHMHDEPVEAYFESDEGELLAASVIDCFSDAFVDNLDCQRALIANMEVLASAIDNFQYEVSGYLMLTLKLNDDVKLHCLTYIVEREDSPIPRLFAFFVNPHLIPHPKTDRPAETITPKPIDSTSLVLNLVYNVMWLLNKEVSKPEYTESEYAFDVIHTMTYFERGEDPNSFDLSKQLCVMLSDAAEETSKVYRSLKRSGLFTIDDIVFPDHPSYIAHTSASSVESLLEGCDFDFLHENEDNNNEPSLLEGIAEFGDDNSEMELIIMSHVLSDTNDEVEDVAAAVFEDHGLKRITFGELVRSSQAESNLYANGRHMFLSLTEKLGQLNLRKNGLIELPDGIDPYVYTSYGVVDIRNQPVWLLLFAFPYTVFKLQSDFGEVDEDEDVVPWFDEDPFYDYVEYIKSLVTATVN